ncbi:hypothetical protein RhiirA4_423200 [Rhizophagus irregularis]|uniref:Uncharacterized protein n=1 Tax=Rhizophagus irregularis TaxID=588596 RepID=A0A2I1GT75_9GLOM|nr:hypothetical protein RhiirA4_423200 [Rhizophagus irregularis]
MDLCKKSEYEFVKKVVNKDSCAGSKIFGVSGGRINKRRINGEDLVVSRKTEEIIKERSNTVNTEEDDAGFKGSYLDTPPQRVYSELSGINEVVKFESPLLSSPLGQRKAIVDSKFEELKEIFEKCGEEMEWEKIEEQTNKDLKGFENIIQPKEIYNLFNRVISGGGVT